MSHHGETAPPGTGIELAPLEAALRAAECWCTVDRVPGDDPSTQWKRVARFRQARWRAARQLPIGYQPYAGGTTAYRLGSRLELERASESGANLITPAALAAARSRVEHPERFEMLRAPRLWADLLSSMPMCFNLFGDTFTDGATAERAVRAWWPHAPRGTIQARFEHSPGRRDRAFLGDQSSFDVAFEITGDANAQGIIGVETKYHEHAVRESVPKAGVLERYCEVAERAGAFVDGWREKIIGTDLQQIWRDHLLVLAMLQHSSKAWSWGKFVLVYPSENPSFASASRRYAALLRESSTYEARTIEELLGASGALPADTVAAFRERYL